MDLFRRFPGQGRVQNSVFRPNCINGTKSYKASHLMLTFIINDLKEKCSELGEFVIQPFCDPLRRSRFADLEELLFL